MVPLRKSCEMHLALQSACSFLSSCVIEWWGLHWERLHEHHSHPPHTMEKSFNDRTRSFVIIVLSGGNHVRWQWWAHIHGARCLDPLTIKIKVVVPRPQVFSVDWWINSFQIVYIPADVDLKRLIWWRDARGGETMISACAFYVLYSISRYVSVCNLL